MVLYMIGCCVIGQGVVIYDRLLCDRTGCGVIYDRLLCYRTGCCATSQVVVI